MVMTYTPKLQLSDEEFQALHVRAEKRTLMVSVKTESLRKLLSDYSAALARFEEVDMHLRSPDSGRPLADDPLAKKPKGT